jgi:NAD(P)-dependent dehydrogenase (short-subunit alcohol dehydrogenase family)
MARPAGGLEGTTALVTGGGTGIGLACAAALIADGATVTICGRTEDTLKRAVATLGASASYVVTDVTDEGAVQSLVEQASASGRLDTVVANAGGGGLPSPTHALDAEEFTRVLNLNVLGTWLVAKHTLPHLVRSQGSFIGMSSIAGQLTHRWFGGYPVGKAGIEAIIRNIADEYGPASVRANAIRPGFIATEIMEGIPRDSAVYESYLENTPLPRLGEPDDVGNLVRFLASSEATWITGQVINVDGGHNLRRGPDFSMFAGVSGDDPRLGIS